MKKKRQQILHVILDNVLLDDDLPLCYTDSDSNNTDMTTLNHNLVDFESIYLCYTGTDLNILLIHLTCASSLQQSLLLSKIKKFGP